MSARARSSASTRRDRLIRRFRRVAWGRLYWRNRYSNMRRFESDDVCIVRNGVATTHYKSLEALTAAIEEMEQDRAVQKSN